METDRSRIISYQQCPRQRYLAYHAHGTGLQKKSKSLPLQFGSAFHEGAEVLLAPSATLARSELRIEGAVSHAHAFLTAQFDAHAVGFDNETPDDAQKAMEYGREEQMALAEALLRAWWAYEGEAFLENFEVIEVERERRAILQASAGEWKHNLPQTISVAEEVATAGNNSLVLMFRPDALVRDKQSGDLYVVSWKTCATFGPRNVNQARTDMQSMSEIFGVEHAPLHADRQASAEEFDKAAADYARYGKPHVEGVLYKWIVKGIRRKDNWDGLYKQGSHLIYGWRKLGTGGGDEAEWSWTYDWEGEDVNPKTGKLVGHKLGKGWQKVAIWREYPGGVKQWVDDLSNGQIFPRHIDALGAIFPQALPVERRADEVESWKRQVVAQEESVAEDVEYLQTIEYTSPETFAEKLDALFPQHTHSCHSYSGCPLIPICHEGVKPEPGDLYQIRQANHPEKGDEE